jgi:hypothetical protein
LIRNVGSEITLIGEAQIDPRTSRFKRSLPYPVRWGVRTATVHKLDHDDTAHIVLCEVIVPTNLGSSGPRIVALGDSGEMDAWHLEGGRRSSAEPPTIYIRVKLKEALSRETLLDRVYEITCHKSSRLFFVSTVSDGTGATQ